MREIDLSSGRVAIVDDCTYDWLGNYNWYCTNDGRYPQRGIGGGKQKIWMHRLIAGYPFYYKVECRNGNYCDCRLDNIRVIGPDRRECSWRGTCNGVSSFAGVVWDARGLWKTEVAGMPAGLYDNELDAARAYNCKLVAIYGPNAKGLNDIPHLPASEQTSMPFTRKDFRQSGYRGVYQNKHGTFSARTTHDGKRFFLGDHPTEEDAKRQIDAARDELRA